MKNDMLRCRAICPREGYGWCIYARKMKGKSCVQIRTFQEKHKCGFTYHNKCVKSTWVAIRYKEKLRDLPNIDLYSFRNKVIKESKLYLTKSQSIEQRKQP
ncbi:hypothetical protein ACH5RR_017515 [Cinchona calisaya]|uniref:Uncharacterized protein n=1 Tax=Cinchona calisaya TaxID=153742 RepID=A0ABD2ZIR4_9GENT